MAKTMMYCCQLTKNCGAIGLLLDALERMKIEDMKELRADLRIMISKS